MPKEIEAYAAITDGEMDADCIYDPEVWQLEKLHDMFGEVWRVKIVPVEKVANALD